MFITNPVNLPVHMSLLSGFYVLMSSADPRQPGDLAKLTTTFVPSTDAEDMCLTFWYSMVGIDTGTLELSR